jgi:coniferyl-aldehyde dehydrogenase
MSLRAVPPPASEVRDDHPDATTRAHLQSELQRHRAAFSRNPYPSARERREHLAILAGLVESHEDEIAKAISADFGHRSSNETRLAELIPALSSIRYASRNLSAWMRPVRHGVHPALQMARAWTEYQPLGVVGVLAPWNYPLQLTVMPTAAALAAGNRVMIKPSEYSTRLAEVLEKLFAKGFASDHVSIHPGEVDVSAAFAALPFDHLFFTGSPQVGRMVMRAAAENLVPVTLELGGKSPFVVDRDFSMERVAPWVAFGKGLNAGQTCVAPDYAFVPRARIDDFVSAVQRQFTKNYPKLAENPDYTSVSSDRHHARLRRYLDDAKAKGARLVEINPAGESTEALGRKLPPTLVLDATPDMLVLQEEIFGPVLSVLPYESLDEVVDYLNARDRPLVTYVFTDDARTMERFRRTTHSGQLVFNATLVHVGVDELPFGGVGTSGMGSYHGEQGFKTFSHARSLYHQQRVHGISLLQPPYGDLFKRMSAALKRFM